MLERVARVCFRHRRAVVAGWAVALVAAGALAAALSGSFQGQDEFGFGDVEAERAHDLLAERFPARAGTDATIVWRAEAGVAEPFVRDRMTGLLEQVARLDQVRAVQSPYDPRTPSISGDDRTALATVQFDADDDNVRPAVLDAFERLIRDADGEGVEVAATGEALRRFRMDASVSEAVGVVAAMVILLVTFGSVVAMGLPIVAAVFSLGVGMLGLSVLARWLDIPEFAPALATMIGLGAGIDYALFVLTRHRSGLGEGLTPEDAAARALGTAGRAVLLAGATVVVSLLGMVLVGIPFVSGMAIASALAVGVTMLGAVTLLPALLGFIGRGIDRMPVPALRRRTPEHRGGPWWQWSRLVQRRPVVAGVGGVTVLVVLALPLFSRQIGSADAGRDPQGSLARRGYDLVADGFGPGFNGPLVVVAEVPADATAGAVDHLGSALGGTDGVALVAPPVRSPDGSLVMLPVIPESAPQAEETTELVHRLRHDVIPAAVAGTNLDVLVGGRTAFLSDTAELLARRLPWFVGAVLAMSFLLLMAVFRSVVVPVKAVAMNLLSIGAAYGVVVAVFQWGWGASLLGVEGTGPIEAFFPLFLFAILFGLSMDYEVFLLTRIHEEYLRTGDNSMAVADGLAATARVITAAAAIMVAIFASVMLADNRILKLFGLGQAVAILIDATIVRLVVVPATMEVLGGANWWLPPWLDRFIPHLAVEHRPAPVHADVPAAVQTRGDSRFKPARRPAGRGDDAGTAQPRHDPPRATTAEPAPTTHKGSP